MAALSLLLGLVVFSCIGCASSNTGRALNVGVVASGALDLHSTHRAIDRGARELNPTMGQHAWQQAAVKAAGTATVIAAAKWLESRSPRWAHVVRAVAITGWSLAAGHNWRVSR